MNDCPFFAQALHHIQIGDWVMVPNVRSNQCALITYAHSPCVMTVGGADAFWETCPRNPANNGSAPG